MMAFDLLFALSPARQRRFRRRRVLKLIADADQGRPALRRRHRLPVRPWPAS